MSKANMISMIDVMYGFSKEECNSLFTQTKDEVERIYINYYQQQDDEQIQISYF
ncbi:BH0509 family protein [Staphylococcus epidermidis]|uniref:BH0509 family protein n=1 Tax=Staphylococcus epidermidis TaxID=1282 RepID=UPI002094F551|nr:BH0509 family protein [Staphylococcus epidermidis]MCO6262928.1 BH0509 family protein [Staphylococcus epidermidis]